VHGCSVLRLHLYAGTPPGPRVAVSKWSGLLWQCPSLIAVALDMVSIHVASDGG